MTKDALHRPPRPDTGADCEAKAGLLGDGPSPAALLLELRAARRLPTPLRPWGHDYIIELLSGGPKEESDDDDSDGNGEVAGLRAPADKPRARFQRRQWAPVSKAKGSSASSLSGDWGATKSGLAEAAFASLIISPAPWAGPLIRILAALLHLLLRGVRAPRLAFLAALLISVSLDSALLNPLDHAYTDPLTHRTRYLPADPEEISRRYSGGGKGGPAGWPADSISAPDARGEDRVSLQWTLSVVSEAVFAAARRSSAGAALPVHLKAHLSNATAGFPSGDLAFDDEDVRSLTPGQVRAR